MSKYLFFILLLLLVPDLSLAAETSRFIPCTGADCDTCDLVTMFNTIIRWLIGFLFLIFAILIFVAGVKLVTSAGNTSALEDAKKSMTNAFIGMVIVFASFVIVNTLMNALLDKDKTSLGTSWSTIKCYEQVAPEKNNTANTSNTTGTSKIAKCSGQDCTKLETSMCKSADSCSVSADLAGPLAQFHADAGVTGARVTEAMPPTRTHQNVCHGNGTCVDYSKAGGMNVDEVKKVIAAAEKNGLYPVYEVRSDEERDALISQGVSSKNIDVLGTWITASHFSIYKK